MRWSSKWIALLLTLAACGAGLWQLRRDGYIPFDEGLLGQSAERVLAGELPHVDFDDTYTGGQAFFHATEFQLFGARSATLRGGLVVLALLCAAAFFAVAADLFGPWPAAALTLIATVWGLASSFTALPTVYNTFFAILCLAALHGHARSGRRSLLASAGFCAGLSILFKVVGFYLLGAALLALVHRHQVRARAAAAAATQPRGWMPALVGAFAASTLLGLWLVLGSAPTAMNGLCFALPVVVLAAALAIEEARPKSLAGRERLRALWPDIFWLAGGCLAPIVLFLLPYLAREGGLAALWQGVFVLPQKRLLLTSLPLPPLSSIAVALPVLAAICLLRGRRGGVALVWLLALGLVVLGLGERGELGHFLVWSAARLLVPCAVAIGCWQLWRRPGAAEEDIATFRVLAVASLVGLVQFPVAAEPYFHQMAPLVVLAVAVVTLPRRDAVVAEPISLFGRLALAAALLIAYLYPPFFLHDAAAFSLGFSPQPKPVLQEVLPARVGLRHRPSHVAMETELAAFVQSRVPPGRPILALPDAPQVYFFCRRPNPTRYFFDALARTPPTPESIAGLLPHVGVVVLYRGVKFSPDPDPRTEALIAASFPRTATFGHFEVRYRDP
jgi:hypothetical protein